LHTENLEKLILVSRNWPNNPKVKCNTPSNLIKFIEMDGNLKNELRQFEGDFEKDEVSKL
jgi:hypothetical protein